MHSNRLKCYIQKFTEIKGQIVCILFADHPKIIDLHHAVQEPNNIWSHTEHSKYTYNTSCIPMQCTFVVDEGRVFVCQLRLHSCLFLGPQSKIYMLQFLLNTFKVSMTGCIIKARYAQSDLRPENCPHQQPKLVLFRNFRMHQNVILFLDSA